MENRPFDLLLRSLAIALFIVCNHYDVCVTGLFGEVVEDITTDRLFEDMGQADVVEFRIEDGVVNFNVALEDRRGQDEFWLIDFQPFVYNGESAINLNTAYLSSNATGTCSNVEQSYGVSEGYFEDDFFQSRNSTGSKELFASYERGFYDGDGTRVDSVSNKYILFKLEVCCV
ncbi:hypothetical protein HOLleu_12970 [Holothuria leucospilota]|uniref:Uncharacterized protein n=1 Tax=Holothuria leucospilota TaxID=206669 RepID=A0A9Q1CC76_HOLLE|nr:hypothetical protein HOLleu_12970 [Holothuria leucospilota]